MTDRVIHFPPRPVSSDESDAAALAIFGTSIPDRQGASRDLHIEDPDVLLSICSQLKGRMETEPSVVLKEAEFFYCFLEKPRRTIGLFDEREYFLGETALLAGVACRVLFLPDEARRWFDRSEANFRHTVNPVAEWARLTYQRMALRVEEREFEQVLELVPSLVESFSRLEMPEDALKCRFLEGVAYINTDRFEEAISLFREVCSKARELGNDKLLATASNNLVQLHGLLGETDQALAAARETLTLMTALNNRVGLGKLQWGVGSLLREQGNPAAAIEAYKAARSEFQTLGMRADVAAVGLILADLFLDAGEDQAAMAEILAALPIIDDLKMVPEGMAALSLLRESLRQQKVNRAALRDLHGYFEEIQA